MKYVDEDRCRELGLPPWKVESIARRIAQAAKEARALGLVVFGGGACASLRWDREHGTRGIVADGLGFNFDGGDGGDESTR